MASLSANAHASGGVHVDQRDAATVDTAPTTVTASCNVDIPGFDATKIKLEGAEDPLSWTDTRKWFNVCIIALMGFISPLGSSILVPGIGLLDRQFQLGSRVAALVPVSLFLLGLGVGPFVLAPASEIRGRFAVYFLSSVVFVLLNIGTATVQNFAGLCVLRFLAGAAGSTGPSLGAGSIGDMFAPAERGRAQALYGLGPLFGPVCGAIAGGWVTQDMSSWRWQLWILTALSGAIAVISGLFLKETYAPFLLQKKVARHAREHLSLLDNISLPEGEDHSQFHEHRCLMMRLAYPNRTVEVCQPAHEQDSSAKARFIVPIVRILLFPLPGPVLRRNVKVALRRPFKLLFTNPICAIFSLYMGFVYGIVFIFITQHPLLYKARTDPDDPSPQRLPTYSWRPGVTSLTYLGLGLGFLVAAATNAFLQDVIYNRLLLNDGVLDRGLFVSSRADVLAHAKNRRAKSAKMQTQDQSHPIDLERQKEAALRDKIEGKEAHAKSPLPRKGRPEFRLPLCLLGMLILPCGLLVFGWTATSHTHWAVPLIGSFLVGMGSILPFQAILVYLVDAFIPYSASATACAVFVRATFAAAFPLFSTDLFVSLGFGWGSSLLALVGALAIPVPILLWFKGEGLRTRFRFEG